MGFVASEGSVIAVGRPTMLASRPFGITSYTGLTEAYEAIYRSQPNVRTVVSFLGRNMAQLNLKLYRRIGDNERRHERDHPLARLLRHPNPRTSRFSFFRALAEDLEVFDNAILLKIRPQSNDAKALLRIPPQYVTPIGDNWLFPEGYSVAVFGRTLERAADEFVHLRGYNPIDSRWGLSPIETLRRILAEDSAAGEYREQLWGRGARSSGIVSRPAEAPAWKTTARDRFREDWKAYTTGTGPEAGGTAILEDGMTFTRDTFNAQELEYIAARKLTRSEVAAAYHVAPSQVGIMESANVNTADGDHRRLYQDTLAPRSVFIEEELLLQLLPDFETDPAALDELYLEHDLEEKLRGDFLAEAEAASRAVGAPFMTRNELRARRNLPPVPGGDELIIPLNVVVGGRASPADTAPGTPGAGQAALPPGTRRKAIGTKAEDDVVDPAEYLPVELQSWVGQHRTQIEDFVARQRNSILSNLGRGDSPVEAFGQDADGRFPRWDTELGDALAGLALEVAPVAAASVSETFDVAFDVDIAEAWLVNNARIAAETFNDQTYNGVADLWPAPTSARHAEADEPVIDDVFVAAAGARAGAFALGRTAQVGNFARHEAARQAGATTKTWHVNSPRPRASHSALSGVTIAADARFSNGGLWPHDPALSADEAAGCTCTVDFTEAELTEAEAV